MPEVSSLVLFCAAALALLLTPGPAVMYIVARSLDEGWTAGIVSSLGISLGTVVHVGAAAWGVSALLESSVTAFAVLQYAGAIYLIYLGIQTLRNRTGGARSTEPPARSAQRIFWQGTIVNLTNPKSALFVFAFLPQFVDPAGAPAWLQILFLGTLLILLGIASDGAWAIAAGRAGTWLRQRGGVLRAQPYVAGVTYIALGLAAAFAGSRSRN